MTIYVPDSLAAEVDAKLSDHNISAICQAALRAVLDRENARARIAAGGFERIEVYDGKRERDVAFQGRRIASSSETGQEAWLTPKGAIAAYDARQQELCIYNDFADLADESWAEDLTAQVAIALGEKYVEELDI